ncbi:MAG: hypothetical protein FWF03_05410 [Defluviitaleaceae bacterium]|nr:hypothetical protein [Defluviitaleaceae bacterium]
MTAVAPGASPEDVSEETGWASRLTGVSQIISTFVNGSVVLKNDGRIYKMGMPDNYYAQWRDVISIVDLSDAFAILRADGTVRVLPFDRDMQRKSNKADEWRDIASIYGKYKRLLGLTRDGGLCAACTDLVWLLRNGSQDFVANWYPIKRPY